MKRAVVLLFLVFGFFFSPRIDAQVINILAREDQKEVYTPWLMYAIEIAGRMQNYYKEYPNGSYFISFEDELSARNVMINAYLILKNRREIQNQYLYIEEMIQIKNAGYLEEYIFFSFNSGTWTNDRGLIETNYKDWIHVNIPNHRPITLAFVREK
jgi:hypothetical protein